MDFARNNLSDSLSPYLRQHADNPIWWQEWTAEALAHARESGKLIFVSVGYSTCHWCHVMAQKTFSHDGVARFLNQNFVSIKIDREERPDIDAFLMSFLVAVQGSGGWPLNAFLTPDLKPIFALTYAPPEDSQVMPGFLHILTRIREFYDRDQSAPVPFTPPIQPPPAVSLEALTVGIREGFDRLYGGFGEGAKFPPHSTLLYLLYAYDPADARMKKTLERTLDAILSRGLFDHLQGGFFRYCVDREWTVPHFEKMLYDQAMGLWVLSLAFRVLGREEYRTAARKTITCLDETFFKDGLYIAAHDADTHHEEGGTYLWTKDELAGILSPEELARFADAYEMPSGGHLEGKIHLIRRRGAGVPDLERKLLEVRRRRPQPFADEKILTSWNALLGCAFVHAYRYLGESEALDRAKAIAAQLAEKHWTSRGIVRSSIDGRRVERYYLEDAAAYLLLLSYLYEETGEFKNQMEAALAGLEHFRTDQGWREAEEKDFLAVAAGFTDHPIPSSVSLAELALARVRVLKGDAVSPDASFSPPLWYDALNVSAMVKNGLFHTITAPQKISWAKLPVNTIQRQGSHAEDCFAGACRPLASR